LLALPLDIARGPKRKTVAGNDGDAGAVVRGAETEFIGAARDIDVEQRRQVRAVRTRKLGDQLRSRANPDSKVGAFLCLGGAPRWQQSSRGNQQLFHPG